MVNKKRVSKVLVFVLLIGTLLSSVAFAADTKDYVIDKDIKISTKAHIQSFGDREFETDDKGVLEFGTTGKAKRLEEFALKLEGAPKDMAIEYRVHGQSYGDMPAEADKWIRGDKEIGSRGKAKRIEGIQIRLVNTETGKKYEGYSVEYQVHMQSFGWGVNKTDKGDVWAKDGEFAGTKGLSKRLEAVRVRIRREDELKVKSVSAINLKQVLVEYNKNIKEGSEAAKKDNYKLVDKDDEEIELSNINVNGKEVVLTIKDGQELENQSKATLTVKKAVTGEAIEEEIDFIDLTVPKVLGAKVIGQDTIKVFFSEPIDEADKDDFKIDGGDYFIESVNFVNNRTEINVKTYSAFDEDTIEIEVGSGIKDFAGLSVLSKTFELEVPDDKEAPYVVGYKDASKSEVTLIFNEDIELNDYDEEDFYHTNSKNTVNDVKLNGAELKLNFKDNPLPEGKAYVYVAGEVVRDLFGNVQKNVIRVVVEVEVDETAPTIKEVKAESQSKLVVTFSETVEDGAEKKANYTILDSKGKEVDVIRKVVQTADDKVTITLSDDLDYGKYTLVVKGVADLSANKANDSYEFTVDDNKAPRHPEEAALYTVNGDKDEYKLVIKFDEPMAVDGQYSVLNLENYKFDGGKYFDELNDEDDITITIKAADQNKTVEINIKGYKVTTSDKIIMARVADAAGNRTAKLQSEPITIKKGSGIGFKSAKATARDTIVVEFNDNFKDFDKEDLAVKYGDEKLNVTKVKTLSSSKIEMTLEKNLDYTAKYDGQDVYVVVVGEKSTNKYGKTLNIGDKIEVSDKIAPALKKTEVDGEEVDYVVVDKDAKIVALYFEENIDPDTVSKVSFEVEDVKVTRAYVVDNVVYLVTDKAAAVNADVTQKAVIKDVNGNKVSDIDTEIASEEIVKVDKKAPEFNYDGETEFVVEYGDEFEIPEVTATDNVDGDVEVTVIITDASGKKVDEIKTEKPGEYTITYTAEDEAGNEAELVITVTVEEAAPEKAAEVTVVSGALGFKDITLNSVKGIEGAAKFKIEESSLVMNIQETIRVLASGDTTTIYILAEDETVFASGTLNVSQDAGTTETLTVALN